MILLLSNILWFHVQSRGSPSWGRLGCGRARQFVHSKGGAGAITPLRLVTVSVVA